ncbi:MAG: glycine oxidase ThiO [Acidobacteria bacterium]|nr:glycine oxidase ThiO [Acidobacteriota bacterium]
MSSRPDVLIVGGGAIGCALARELAGRGAAVTVLERAEPGSEASGAAAGLIAPRAERLPRGPLFDLAAESRRLYPGWCAELERETGLPVGWSPNGVLRCDLDGRADFSAWLDRQASAFPVEEVDRDGVQRLSRGLVSPDARGGLFFREDGSVDPRRLTRALWESAATRGVRFVLGVSARRFHVSENRCRGVETDGGVFEAGAVVDAAGAWAAFDPETAPLPVKPVRGQIVRLAGTPPFLPRVVQSADVYVVPRADGSVVLGSTEEDVGFRKDVTAGAVAALIDAACRLVPSLRRAQFMDAWSGLRPASRDALPILGASRLPGLFFAAGHFRNGILLAPVTAVRVADSILADPGESLAPFAAARFATGSNITGQPWKEPVFG